MQVLAEWVGQETGCGKLVRPAGRLALGSTTLYAIWEKVGRVHCVESLFRGAALYRFCG